MITSEMQNEGLHLQAMEENTLVPKFDHVTAINPVRVRLFASQLFTCLQASA